MINETGLVGFCLCCFFLYKALGDVKHVKYIVPIEAPPLSNGFLPLHFPRSHPHWLSLLLSSLISLTLVPCIEVQHFETYLVLILSSIFPFSQLFSITF